MLNIARAFLQVQPNPNTSSICYLAGATQHFCGKKDDKGFGCGFRNIQMLVSHLLTGAEPFRQVLFGGVQFVPDVASLQAWLECSWSQGFDMQGMSTLNGKVQGTRKWIGTAEVVTLLRQFGIQAEYVDFLGTNSTHQGFSQQNAIHHGVSCDFCDMDPIIGRRHSSLCVPDFDLCDHCVQIPTSSDFGPFSISGKPIIHAKSTCAHCKMSPIVGVRYLEQEKPRRNLCENCYWNSHLFDQDRFKCMFKSINTAQQNGNKHEKLIQWVWKYFTDEELGASESINLNDVVQTDKAPLYFQHDGHSRTIVGIEQVNFKRQNTPTRFSLILLDPSTQSDHLEYNLNRGVGWQRQLKRGLHTLQNPEYQLVYIKDELIPRDQLHSMKTIRAKEQIQS